MEIVSENRAYGGVQGVYSHASSATDCDMVFAIYLPPQAKQGKVPCLWYLSGLTCTHENAMTKAAAQGYAAEFGVAIVFPDTSPRGDGVADDEAYDLGQGAGFYVDATEQPWAPHFQMYTYITDNLRRLVAANFPVDEERFGITGHSMGGHGALTLAMRNPDLYRSVSAFAPIAHPSASDWGTKQLTAYLGRRQGDLDPVGCDRTSACHRLEKRCPDRPGDRGSVPAPAEARGSGHRNGRNPNRRRLPDAGRV